MKFIRQNLTLLIMLVVFLVLLGVGILLLRKKKAESDSVREELSQKLSEKADLLGRSPSRTPPNIDQIRKNAEEEKKLIDEILQKLRPSEPPAETEDPIRFKEGMVSTLRQMNNEFRPSIKLPDKFKFGFESYEEGRLPKLETTPLLRKQIKVVDELMRLCVSNNVFEVISFGRPEVEGVPLSKGHVPMTEPLLSSGGKVDYINSPDYLYSTMSFSMELMCDTDSLRNLMNDLGRSPFIFIPRLVLVENEKKDPLQSTVTSSTPAGPPSSVGGGHTGPLAKPPVAPGRPAAPMVDLNTLPFVLGEERIRVSMLVDWLEFHTDSSREKKGKDTKQKHSMGKGGETPAGEKKPKLLHKPKPEDSVQ